MNKFKSIILTLCILGVISTNETTTNNDYLNTIEVHNCPVSGLAVFEEEDIFITAGIIDKQVKVWRISDYTLIKTIEDHTDQIRGVVALRYGDQKHFATHSFDQTIKIYDLKTLTLLHTLIGSNNRVMKLSHLKGSQFIVSISANQIYVWNYLEGGRPSLVIDDPHGLNQSVTGITQITHNPPYFATFASDNFIKVWDSETGENVVSMLNKTKDKIFTIAYIEHLDSLLTADMGGSIYRWNWKAGKNVFVYKDYKEFFPIDIGIIPNSNLIILGGFGSKAIKFIDVSKYNTMPLYEKQGHLNEIWKIQYINGTGLFFSSAADYSVKQWTVCQKENEYYHIESGKCVDNCLEIDDEKYTCLSIDHSKQQQQQQQQQQQNQQESQNQDQNQNGSEVVGEL